MSNEYNNVFNILDKCGIEYQYNKLDGCFVVLDRGIIARMMWHGIDTRKMKINGLTYNLDEAIDKIVNATIIPNFTIVQKLQNSIKRKIRTVNFSFYKIDESARNGVVVLLYNISHKSKLFRLIHKSNDALITIHYHEIDPLFKERYVFNICEKDCIENMSKLIVKLFKEK